MNWRRFAYLNMNIKRISNEKNIATLSIVRSITNNWRRRFGMNRTNLRIRNKRNVRNTLSPELPSLTPSINCWPNSKTLLMHVDFHRVVQFVRGLWKNQEKKSKYIFFRISWGNYLAGCSSRRMCVCMYQFWSEMCGFCTKSVICLQHEDSEWLNF